MGWFTGFTRKKSPFTNKPSVSASNVNFYDKLDRIYINGFGGYKSPNLPYSYQLKLGTNFSIIGKYNQEGEITPSKKYDIYYGQEETKEYGTIRTFKDQTLTIPGDAYKRTNTNNIEKYDTRRFRLIPSTYKIEKVTYEGKRTIIQLMNVHTDVDGVMYPAEEPELYGGRRKRLTKRRKALRHRRRRRTIRA